jgi:hypothetical protein
MPSFVGRLLVNHPRRRGEISGKHCMSNESFSLAMPRRGGRNISDPTAVAFVTEPSRLP